MVISLSLVTAVFCACFGIVILLCICVSACACLRVCVRVRHRTRFAAFASEFFSSSCCVRVRAWVCVWHCICGLWFVVHGPWSPLLFLFLVVTVTVVVLRNCASNQIGLCQFGSFCVSVMSVSRSLSLGHFQSLLLYILNACNNTCHSVQRLGHRRTCADAVKFDTERL